jgi:hypothetical protein
VLEPEPFFLILNREWKALGACPDWSILLSLIEWEIEYFALMFRDNALIGAQAAEVKPWSKWA